MQVSKEQVEKWQEIILPSIQVFARFYNDEIVDITESNKQKKRVTKKCLILETKVRGDRFSLLNKEATEKDKKIYHKEYNLFLESENVGIERTEKPVERVEKPVVQINSNSAKNRKGSHLEEVQTGWCDLRIGTAKQTLHNKPSSLNIQWVNFENA
ncbi:MAG: hypothetical protein L3J83_03710 [Proteobacteria bacterium]|nr:hypothetical protein [Pseudomonadota bacterium]